MPFLYSFPLCIFLIAFSTLTAGISENTATKKLQRIHSDHSLLHGSFSDEYPEQVMAVMFITKNDHVLEIGGNIGRNSCVIASILKNSANLVVVESDPDTAAILLENRDLNGFVFQIEDSAISEVPLIQKDWNTIPSNTMLPGYFSVKTITYGELKAKYNLQFNVLVADCEGALYYILNDDESLLDDVETIIVENDYTDRDHYDTVRMKFQAHGFKLVYNKAGGWGPCFNVFYQVWLKS